MREIDVVFDPERKLFLYFGVVFLAIAVGPFGTYEAMSFWERTFFWSLDVLGGMLIVVPILHIFYDSKLVAFLPSPVRFFLGVALGALPTAGYITILYGTIGSELEISTPFPLLFGQVTVFSSTLLLTEYILWPAVFGTADTSDVDEPIPSEPPPPPGAQMPAIPLMERLPPNQSDGTVISISMQDHYAEVTTTAGKTLILMRLSDAIDLLKGYPGTQIHRSHWVARDFVSGIEKNGRRMDMLLKDGRRLPIGNTYLMAARQQLQLAPVKERT